MNCIKCGGKILDDCCVKCGFMNNGNHISLKDREDDLHDIKIFQKNFNTVLYNTNKFIVFLVGPLYLAYKGYPILGAIITYLDMLLYYVVIMLINLSPFLGQIGFLIMILYYILSRSLYSATLNYLVLKLDNRKLKKIKKNKKYKTLLLNHKNSILYPILVILSLVLIFALCNN